MSCVSLFLALSMHVGLDNTYNTIHPHARCTIDNNIAGVYYNSEYNISSYIGKKINKNSFEIEYGLVSGYSSNTILPMLRVKKGIWFITPAYEITGNAGVVVGIEWNIL